MKFKYILFLIYWLLSLSIISAQNKSEQLKKSTEATLADKFFNNSDYSVAIKHYTNALKDFPQETYLTYRLAECYRFINDYTNAETSYKSIVDKIYKDSTQKSKIKEYPLVLFYYGKSLKSNEKCEAAKEQFDMFLSNAELQKIDTVAAYHNRALLEYNGCAFLNSQKINDQTEIEFKRVLPPVNSSNSDYAPALFKNDSTLFFTSARPSKKSKTYKTTGENFSDIYLSKKNVELWQDISKEKNLDKLNSELNDGAACYNIKNKKLYFTRCDIKHQTSKGECNIYVSNYDGKTWSHPQALNENINTKEYWSAQPSLTPSGDTLFFVSKRPGGKGNHDIWYSTKPSGSENWGAAKNLSSVNTTFSEVSPFYDGITHSLYFSSNGYEGFGELDIYKTQDSTFEKPENIGLPFNSPRDDFYFIKGNKYGYITSNRTGGLGNDDIYRFNLKEENAILAVIPKDTTGAQSISITGNVINQKTYTSAPNLPIVVKDSAGNTVLSAYTDDEGKFRFSQLDAKKSYTIEVKDKNFLKKNKLAATVSNEYDRTESDSLSTNTISTETAKTNEQTNSANSTNDTNNLSAQNSSSSSNKKSSKNTKNSSANITASNESLTEDEPNKYEVKNLKIKPSNTKASASKYEYLFFDFDSYQLRPESKTILDELYGIIQAHPELQIELNAYTDNIGTTDYNKKLSNLRSEEAFNYLKSKGIDKTALIQSFGEDDPLAPNTNPIGRQLNRRLNFKISGTDTVHIHAQAYVAGVNENVNDIARKFKVPVEEIKRLSHLESDSLAPFRPIRIPTKTQKPIHPLTLEQAKGQEFNKYNLDYDHSGLDALQNRGEIIKHNGQTFYVVAKGNTLFGISRFFRCTPEELIELNNLINNEVKVGQKIRVFDNRAK